MYPTVPMGGFEIAFWSFGMDFIKPKSAIFAWEKKSHGLTKRDFETILYQDHILYRLIHV
jgi:hypothetical protein